MLEELGDVVQTSPIISSPPLGPSKRRYANAAAILQCPGQPDALLAQLTHLERMCGARRGGRWRARVLDLDIILWSGGMWAGPGLSIPHREFRKRDFVLGPASAIAPGWIDPLSNLSLRQLNARLTKPRPVLRGRDRWCGPLAQSVEQLTFNQ